MATPLDIVKEYNQYTQPVSIADTYVAPDMVDGFLLAFAFNALTIMFIIMLFLILRKPCRKIYSSRLLSKLRYDEYDGKYYVNLDRLRTPGSYYDRVKPPSQEFSESTKWIRFLFRHSEEQVFHDLGPDETVTTKVFVLSMDIFSVILVLNIPLYAYFAIDNETHFEWNHSMADVEPGSWILWVYFCFVWIKSLVCLYYLWRHTKSFVNLRQQYLVSGVEAVGRFEDRSIGLGDKRMMVLHKRSIFVDHIPRGKRTEERIRELFERGIWKGRVRSVYVKRRAEAKVDHDRKVRTVRSRKASLSGEEKKKTPPPADVAGDARGAKRNWTEDVASAAGDVASAISSPFMAAALYTTTLHGERVSWQDLHDEYVSWEKLPKPQDLAPTRKIDCDGGGNVSDLFGARLRIPKHSSPLADALVVFDSAYTANVAAQMSFTVDSGLRTRLAPSPLNMYESNVGYHGFAGFDMRFFCTILFYVALILFWAVPVSLVASLTSIDTLEEKWTWIKNIRDHPYLFDLVQTYLPTLGLYLFMTLLPYILQYASRFEGLKTKSEMDEALMYRYFIFLLMNILLVASLSGGIFAILYSVSYEGGLSDIPELLGKSLPNMYLFFVSYVMLQAMTILPLDLLRIPSLVAACWYRTTTSGDGEEEEQKERKKAKSTSEGNASSSSSSSSSTSSSSATNATDEPFSFADIAEAASHRGHGSGENLARHLLVFSISLVYSSFTPLMLPFSLFYFSFGLILHRHQAYYVYVKPYESGGDMWMYVIHCVIAGLVVYILAIMGMIILLDGIMQAFALTPLLFVVFAMHYYLRGQYGSLLKYMALSSTFDYRTDKGDDAGVAKRPVSSINAGVASSSKCGDEHTPLLDEVEEDEESGERDDPWIAFRVYASEFGGTFGSLSGLFFENEGDSGKKGVRSSSAVSGKIE
eukprot:g5338.t1